MLSMNMNANFSGSCIINEVVIANFNATYSGDASLYFNVSVSDHSLFAQNRTEVDEDFQAFMDKVLESVGELED